MFIRKKSQSVLEYALLIAVIIAAILIMQVFIKRGYSGRLKDSADRMGGGESYSAGSTTIKSDSRMLVDQTIIEETATGSSANSAIGAVKAQMDSVMDGTADFENHSLLNVSDTASGSAYSATRRSGGRAQSTTSTITAAAGDEDFRSSEYTGTDTYERDEGDFTDDTLLDDAGDDTFFTAPSDL